MRPLVVIPARLAATRLPGKPLADIHGEPMIVHVWRRAVRAALGPVVVACPDPEIAAAVRAVGGAAVPTGRHHASGSDRVFEAAGRFDPEGVHDVVVNLQGDLPDVDPADVRAVLAPLALPDVPVATLAAPLDAAARDDPAAVKVRLDLASGARVGRVLAFSRDAALCDDGPCRHHVGVYAFRRAALARFVALPPTAPERRENLEQLRALDAGMAIGAALIDSLPLGVDTPADLARVRAALAAGSPASA